ncbi:hypothetical protein [Natrononativus amylolyticus]|uniref:hypothetical protein n=1 Tax=Natrononativus amylolyticus TaxID=2963434 RepID=UPI0020CE9020|nr:hypothetical protein [Natrononativus amylolyticus]
MNVRDFTFDAYDRLVGAAVDADYEVLTVAEYLRAETLPERYLILRHDVDRRVEIARSMARLEARHGVASTYYFRTSTFEPEIVAEMAEMGHEIGYHYEDLARARGDRRRAHRQFAANLAAFREHATIETACSHGSPLSRHLNLDIWEGERSPAEYDLLGEAYLDVEKDDEDPTLPSYLSDTGRRWGTVDPDFGLVETTDDFVEFLEAGDCPRLYVLAHPGRWSRSRLEFVDRLAWDVAAETGKIAVKPAHYAQRGVANATGGVVRAVGTTAAVAARIAQATAPRGRER